ncbi:MAG: PilN domain-containing protein [bacterium]|nr:PilN domain-containing protein [bacterium]
MLTLNLLSSQQKHKLRKEQANKFLKELVITVVLTTVTISVLVSASKAIVVNSVEKYIANNTSPDEIINVKIKNINNLANFLHKIQTEHINWSGIIIDITKRVPAKIIISHLSFNEENSAFTISGFSPSRSELLKFKDDLTQIPELENVDLPIQNLSQKDDISFNIKADLIIKEMN